VNRYIVQPRSRGIARDATWLAKLRAFVAARRWRRPSTDRLPDHLLRDAGLDRIGGVTRHRLR
jgi:hypothetical protein